MMKQTLIFLTAVIMLSGVRAESVRIMPLGDSITQSDHRHESYRRPLWHKLKKAGYDVDFVGSTQRHHKGDGPKNDFDMDHEGHWGWRGDEIYEKIEGWAAAAKPDIVLCHLGTNDVFQKQSARNAVMDIDAIIDVLRKQNPKVTILLAQVIPTTRLDKPIVELNTTLAAYAKKKHTETSNVILVDQYTGFDAKKDTFDGVHPDGSGEEKMASKWFAALEGILTK